MRVPRVLLTQRGTVTGTRVACPADAEASTLSELHPSGGEFDSGAVGAGAREMRLVTCGYAPSAACEYVVTAAGLRGLRGL